MPRLVPHFVRLRALALGLAVGPILAAGTGLATALPAPLAAQGSTSEAKNQTRERERERERARREAEQRRQERERERQRRPRPAREGAARMRLDTTVAMDARGLVELTLNGGDVIVRTWDRAEVRVSAQLDNGHLSLDASASRVLLGDAEHSDADARFEVTMPRTARLEVAGINAEVVVDGVRGGVQVENATGDVQLTDVGGLVRAELMTGELHVTRGEGDFRLSLASGDVMLQDVTGRVEVENVSGDITVRGGRARELRLETTSGDVTYEGTVQAEGTYELSTHSGDVQLRLPEGTRARLEAETYNGEFVSDFPVTMQPGAPKGGRQRRYELLVGDGGGPLIRVESFTGDIHLGRTAVARAESTPRDNR
jgi:DUF4097 and DUF4098 domain-containing protein YvlB